MNFENKLEIGIGIYTKKEIAQILQIPSYKIDKWMNKYRDGKLGVEYQNTYSWEVENSRAISFHTLIEFYILSLFGDAGIKYKDVLKIHSELMETFDTPFPFAKKNVLENIRINGKKILIKLPEGALSLYGEKQFQIQFMEIFFQNLEFDDDLIANKLYPLGKEKKIIVDPERQFGHPVISNTNIFPEAIFNMHIAGEPVPFIAFSYEIGEEEVKDAIEYCKAA